MLNKELMLLTTQGTVKLTLRITYRYGDYPTTQVFAQRCTAPWESIYVDLDPKKGETTNFTIEVERGSIWHIDGGSNPPSQLTFAPEQNAKDYPLERAAFTVLGDVEVFGDIMYY